VKTILGPFARSAVHEWIGWDGMSHRGSFRPPLLLFNHLVQCALADQPEKFILWIGRQVWPYAVSLPVTTAREGAAARAHLLLSRSLFIDPPDDETRLWAIDLALRSPAGGVVIADESKFDMAQSRRLQLAAKSGDALVLLARPPQEAGQPSAAASRWLVSTVSSPSHSHRFLVQLVRCKGAQRGLSMATDASSSAATRSVAPSSLPLSFLLEWNHEKGCVRLPSDVADRPHPQTLEKRAG